MAACQGVFLASSEMGRFKAVLDSLAGRSVLTVGESKGFAARGGIVNFVLEDGRVRFEINHTAAIRANLKISSELLQVATIVESRPEVR
jgi:hypothetical protein